jgi:hypothetical protein
MEGTEGTQVTIECDIESIVYNAMQAARHYTPDSKEYSEAQWRIAIAVLQQYTSQKGTALRRNFAFSTSPEEMAQLAPSTATLRSLCSAKEGEESLWHALVGGPHTRDAILSDSRRHYAVVALEAAREFLSLQHSAVVVEDYNLPLIKHFGYYLHPLASCMFAKERFRYDSVEAICNRYQQHFSEHFRVFFRQMLREQT